MISGVFFIRWRRLSDNCRKQLWGLYGWFTGIMLCGSCCGAINWALWTQFLVNYYQSGIKSQYAAKYQASVRHHCYFHSPIESLKIRPKAPNTIFFGFTYQICTYQPSTYQFIYTWQPLMSNMPSNIFMLAIEPVIHFQALRWLCGFLLLYPATFCFIIVSQLLVVDRITQFVNVQVSSWMVATRVLVGVVVVGNVVGLIGNSVGIYFLARAAEAYDETPAAFNGSYYDSVALSYRQRGAQAAAVHLVCEFCVLLFVTSAFIVAGFASTRKIAKEMISRTISADSGQTVLVLQQKIAETGKLLRRRILWTAGVIFASFLCRIIYSIMFAIANLLNNSDANCSQFTGRCGACYNNFTYMQIWMLYNPEFNLAVIFFAQNVTLLVALWGMTSEKILSFMRKEPQVQHTDKRERVSESPI
jgi:hypothetical protein